VGGQSDELALRSITTPTRRASRSTPSLVMVIFTLLGRNLFMRIQADPGWQAKFSNEDGVHKDQS
jgi:hypothetical protein